MATVKVEISELRKNESAIQQQIRELSSLNARLESLLTRMESSWDGEASEAYMRLLRRYAQQTAKMVTVLEEYKGYVKNTADTFESMDKNSANRIRGSF